MEKINIAELLKDCPKGMELDCMMYDNVTLYDVDLNKTFPILLIRKTGERVFTTEYGQYQTTVDSKCIIFPKGKTTWKGFVPPRSKFKVGDRVKQIGSDIHYIIKNIEFDRYILNNNQFIRFIDEHRYELAQNKFDITTFRPFDKVLVRDNDEQMWTADIFSFYNEKHVYPFMCAGHYTNQCIPYEQNKHLLGTTNDCNEFYKTWE